MKKLIARLLCILLFILWLQPLHAQGIQFAYTNFPAALEMAKKQNKLVFIDVYTDWCGPCKAMEKNIFPQEKVGQLYNDNFICCRINAEKDGGPTLAKQYEVNAYPTFLFITPEGELLAKGIGYKENADLFLELGQSALHKKATNYSISQMVNNYEQNKNNKQFLTAYIARLDSLDLKKDLVPVLDQYCQVIGTPSAEDYNLLIKHLYTASSTSFDILLDHQATAYKYFNQDALFPDKEFPKPIQFEIILNNAIIQALQHATENSDPQEFNQIINKDRKINHLAPKFPLTIFAFSAQFYQMMKDTGSLFQTLHKFSDTLLPAIFPIASSIDSMYALNAQNPTLKGSYKKYLAYTINNAADKYLRNSSKNNDYKKALTLSQQSLTLIADNPEFLNTSARSYYLLNKKEQAIQFQQQAIKYSKDNQSLNIKYVAQLADMQAGKKL